VAAIRVNQLSEAEDKRVPLGSLRIEGFLGLGKPPFPKHASQQAQRSQSEQGRLRSWQLEVFVFGDATEPPAGMTKSIAKPSNVAGRPALHCHSNYPGSHQTASEGAVVKRGLAMICAGVTTVSVKATLNGPADLV